MRCECGATRRLSDASKFELNPLGTCRGARPWLGRDTNEECSQPSRLLVRTASNAWFPAGAERALHSGTGRRGGDRRPGALGRPADRQRCRGSRLHQGASRRWRAALASFDDDEVLTAIGAAKGGGAASERSVKEIELEAILAAPDGFGDDVPVQSRLPCPATAGRAMAAVGADPGRRRGHPAPPAPRGGVAGRLHTLRGGDAGHPRRVRDGRRARGHRAGAELVPRGGEPG